MAYRLSDQELKQLAPLLGAGENGEASGGALLALSDLLAAKRQKPERLLAFDNAFSRMFYPEESGGDQVGQKKGMGDAGMGAEGQGSDATLDPRIQSFFDNFYNSSLDGARRHFNQNYDGLKQVYGEVYGADGDGKLTNDMQYAFGVLQDRDNSAKAATADKIYAAGTNGQEDLAEEQRETVLRTGMALSPEAFTAGDVKRIAGQNGLGAEAPASTGENSGGIHWTKLGETINDAIGEGITRPEKKGKPSGCRGLISKLRQRPPK